MAMFVIGSWIGALINIAIFDRSDWGFAFATGASVCWIVSMCARRTGQGGGDE
ncbi:hypothetical protein HYQ43_04480 [Paracoccus pantotrophus]|uniref:Uncharacterized protein n=1 Tax=Paracoccus pantotrophus TaxID=82367 RepID=A0A7H9BQJ5_PARPN|nr:hypothetical protein [Paracoccus pantotrophus]QLH13542.1 hypothetical protein HYQ43_04480 [Paracoccus pantotrophus]